MKVKTIVTGTDLTEGIRFYGDTHYDNESKGRLKDLALLLGDVFSDLKRLERQVEDRGEGSAREIKCLLEMMREDLLCISFGEEIAEEIIKLLEVDNDKNNL